MKFGLLALGLLGCCFANGQQRFIEVTVSDTVLAKADLFAYRIVVMPNIDQSEVAATPDTLTPYEEMRYRLRVLARHRLDSLILILRSDGFFLSNTSLGDSVAIRPAETAFFSARVITRSVDSLSILYNRLKHMRNIQGFLEMAVAANDSLYQKVLFGKILEEAWTKARRIAVYSGQHLKGVMSVAEDKEDERHRYGWTTYPPLSELADNVIPGWHTTITEPASIVIADPSQLRLYPLAATFTVRFWVE